MKTEDNTEENRHIGHVLFIIQNVLVWKSFGRQ